MATTLTPPESSASPPRRKRFTRYDVQDMLEAGLFAGQRYELIDGDLIDKMGQGPRHAFGIRSLLNWLASIFGTPRVQVQLPIEAAEDEREQSIPEPDLAVLVEWKAEYLDRHPHGDEILLTVEIADTSARFDLVRKASLYAHARVAEYWVLNIARRELVVHRQPDGTQYRSIQIYSEDQTVSIEGRAEAVRVGDLLPPPQPLTAPPQSAPDNPPPPAS